MSFKDPAKQKEYQREYARSRRAPAGVCQTPGQTPLPAEFRLKTARDVLDLLATEIANVRADVEAGTVEKARAVGYLASIALRAVETAELTDRVEAVERALKDRKENPACPSEWPRAMND